MTDVGSAFPEWISWYIKRQDFNLEKKSKKCKKFVWAKVISKLVGLLLDVEGTLPQELAVA